MTYTTKQRRAIYETALNYFLLLREAGGYALDIEWNPAKEQWPVRCVCFALCDVAGISRISDYALESFKEFAIQFPPNSIKCAAWWKYDESGLNSRIQALEQAIALTYKTPGK